MILKPAIFKAYDVRGLYPSELDEGAVARIATAYVATRSPQTMAVGGDVRLSTPSLKAAVMDALVAIGVRVIDIGTVTTDQLYFAVGHFGYDGGIMVSASHNPAEYNGLKFIDRGGGPFSSEDLSRLRDWAISEASIPSSPGTVTSQDILEDYVAHVSSFIDPARIRPLRVVANANFGAVGRAADAVSERLGLILERINWEPDGSFPKGPPNPILPENRAEIVAAVRSGEHDLGVGWDADADRCFFVTPSGRFVPGCFITALLAHRVLERHPGESIVYDLTHIWAVEDAVKEAGGVPALERVGHTFIKSRMRAEDAPFGGESSGHYYFRDNFYADNGLIPFLMVCELLSETGRSLDELLEPYFSRYFLSDELNYPVAEASRVMASLRAHYASGDRSEQDGLSVTSGTWRFNIRPSNTEPLVRLNVESRASEAELKEKVEALSELIRAS